MAFSVTAQCDLLTEQIALGEANDIVGRYPDVAHGGHGIVWLELGRRRFYPDLTDALHGGTPLVPGLAAAVLQGRIF